MFYLLYLSGLLLFQNIDPYEIPEGGFRSGIELIKYDKKEKKIYWRIVGTTKKTQYFKIQKNGNVEYFDGNVKKNIKKYN